MPIHYLEHFLLQCADIEATAAWYVRVLGLRDGEHPDFKIPVKWLYAEDRDVIHITEGGANVSENRMKYLGQQSTVLEGTGVIDHAPFRTPGPKEIMAGSNQQKGNYTPAAPTIRRCSRSSCSIP